KHGQRLLRPLTTTLEQSAINTRSSVPSPSKARRNSRDYGPATTARKRPMSDVKRREFIKLLGGAAAAIAGPLAAAADDYPNHSITLVVNFPPGGSTDAMARILREPLSQGLGQNIIIDNRAGAGGTTGAAAVANAKPDGYTLLLSVNLSLITNKFLQKNF